METRFTELVLDKVRFVYDRELRLLFNDKHVRHSLSDQNTKLLEYFIARPRYTLVGKNELTKLLYGHAATTLWAVSEAIKSLRSRLGVEFIATEQSKGWRFAAVIRHCDDYDTSSDPPFPITDAPSLDSNSTTSSDDEPEDRSLEPAWITKFLNEELPLLQSLPTEDQDKSVHVSSPQGNQTSTLIALDQLVIWEYNVRKNLTAGQTDSDVDELAASICRLGLLSPLTVRPTPLGQFEVLVGQRRLLACKKLKLDPVHCFIRENISTRDAVAMSLAENLHRADMLPLDKAYALKALYDLYQSYARVETETGLSHSTIKKYLKLLDLPVELRKLANSSSGSSNMTTLVNLATHFSGDDAIKAKGLVDGFAQPIQNEIIKRSGGDLEKVPELVVAAQEGAFNIRRCGGSYGCDIIRDIIERRMTESDFQHLVQQALKETLPLAMSNGSISNASREFWRALALG